jgi:predicted amidohydrolase YtcJ
MSESDLALINRKIWNVNDRWPEVEAVAVLDNRIAAVCLIREIRKWISANTKSLTLKATASRRASTIRTCISSTAGWG